MIEIQFRLSVPINRTCLQLRIENFSLPRKQQTSIRKLGFLLKRHLKSESLKTNHTKDRKMSKNRFYHLGLLGAILLSTLNTFPLMADEKIDEKACRCIKERVAGSYLTQVFEEPLFDPQTGELLDTRPSRARLQLHADGTADIQRAVYSNAVNSQGEIVYPAERTSFNQVPRTGTWKCVGPRQIRIHTNNEFYSNSYPFKTPAEQGAPLSELIYTFNVSTTETYTFDEHYNCLTGTGKGVLATYSLDQDVNDPKTVPLLARPYDNDIKFERVRNFVPPLE